MLAFLQHFFATVFIALSTIFITIFGHTAPPIAIVPAATSTAPTIIATTTPAKIAAPLPKTKLPSAIGAVSSSAPVETAPIAAAQVQLLNQADVNVAARAALVNIFCTTASGGAFEPISGSGVIIDPRGVILTVAHVAEYYLLQNYQEPGFITCTIRTGSPAVATYTAEPLYISPSWVEQNAGVVASSSPMGTGEHDFALLRIISTTDGSPLPASFSYLPTDTSLSNTLVESPVLLASYPAQFAGGITIAQDLYADSTVVSIGQLYTFSSITADVFSLGGSIDAQEGASGGAVVSLVDGHLLGLIATAGNIDAANTSQRDLRAISLDYVNRDILAQTGQNLSQFLTGDIAAKATLFNQTIAPKLTALIEAQIPQ